MVYELATKGLQVGTKLVKNINQQMAILSASNSPSPATDTLSPLSPGGATSPRPLQHNASSSSAMWEPPEAVVTVTETSESMSREATPVRELETPAFVRLSLFIQGTVPKFVLKLYSTDDTDTQMCLTTSVEDLWTTIDIKQVVSKVTCKVGAADITHAHKG